MTLAPLLTGLFVASAGYDLYLDPKTTEPNIVSTLIANFSAII